VWTTTVRDTEPEPVKTLPSTFQDPEKLTDFGSTKSARR
jgi:hypothetical protein